MSSIHSRILVAAAAFLIAAAAFAPVLKAGFQYEDLFYLALVRHIDSPWALLSGNVFFSYYFRATGLAFWWLSVQLAGQNAWWHNLFDLLLFASNAALLTLYTIRLTSNRVAGLIAGVAFACLPAASSTSMWMSDRYDPLALLFGLLALFAFENTLVGVRRAAVWTALWLFLAIAAKEVAYVIALGMLLRLAAYGWAGRRWNPAVIAAIVVPIIACLILRELTVLAIDDALDTRGKQTLSDMMLAGVGAWWQRLPIALFGFRSPSAWLWWLVAALMLLMLSGLFAAFVAKRDSALKLALIGALCAIVPSIVQWPVTGLILPYDDALNYVVNLRFYHLAMAGVALLLGAAWTGLRSRSVRAGYAIGLLVLCGAWFADARANAHAWHRDDGTHTQKYLTFGADLGARAFSAGCRIFIDAKSFPEYMRSRIDITVKSAVSRDASILGCSISASSAPYFVFVKRAQCSAQAWPGLQVKPFQGAIEPHDKYCAIVFATLDDGSASVARFYFRMRADGHAEEIPAPVTNEAKQNR